MSNILESILSETLTGTTAAANIVADADKIKDSVSNESSRSDPITFRLTSTSLDTSDLSHPQSLAHLANFPSLNGIKAQQAPRLSLSLNVSKGLFDGKPPTTTHSSPSVLPGGANAFGVPTSTTSTIATGDNNIDGLLVGTHWTSTSVSFSFTDSFTDYESGYPNASVHSTSFQTLNATQRNVAREWLTRNYYNVSLLNPVELSGASDRDATIRIAMSNAQFTAFGYYPGNTVEAGDIWFNPSDYNSPAIGNYAYHTFGHELGHALGLKHGHELGGIRNVAMNSDRDSMEFSIMTYRSYVGHDLNSLPFYTNETWGYAQSLMMYDIRAIQQMYGPWFGYNSGNTTYTFSTTTGEMFVDGIGQGTPGANRVFRTIWDGNGIDSYDFSNYTTKLSIDLMPGGWSDLDVGGNFQRAMLNIGHGGIIKYARAHVFNALQYNGDARSLIENAYGGSADDTIVGNIANNVLKGNGGNDTINGGAGVDTLYGGVGNDTVDGGDGNDLIFLEGGNDYLDIASLGNDTFYGGTGNDFIFGYTGNEFYYGEDGNDTLKGFSGNDILNGGAGVDNIEGGSGNDTLTGGGGNDILNGGAGKDYFKFNSFNDKRDTINGFSIVDDTIQVSAGGFGGGLVAGSAITAAQFRIGSAAADSSDRFIYNNSNGALWFDRDGNGGGFLQVQIASLTSGLAMTNNDIFVIA
jgi:serralysin